MQMRWGDDLGCSGARPIGCRDGAGVLAQCVRVAGAAGATGAVMLVSSAAAQSVPTSSPASAPLLAVTPAVDAVELPTLRWSGFGTLGLTYHRNDDVGMIRAFSQKKPAQSGWSGRLDTVLGLQMDAQLLSATSATVQAVARAGDDGDPKLRMAYLRQQFGQDTALRIGRLRSTFYLDSDVNEIGFAYLTARPPLPLYNFAANNVPHLDGADLQWRYPIGPAAMLVNAYAGRSGYKQVFYNNDPDATADARFSGIRGLALGFSLPQVTLRASRTWVREFTIRARQIDQINSGLAQISAGLQGAALDPTLPAPAQAALRAKADAVSRYSNPFDNEPVYTSIGFDANWQQWRLMAEWAQFDSNSQMIGKYRGYHATLSYNIREFTPYLTWASNKRIGPALDAGGLDATGASAALDAGLQQLQGALVQASRFADLSTRSIGAGVRWDARENLAAKLQFEHFRTPSADTPGAFAVSGLPIRNSFNLFSATLDFIF